MLLASIGTPGKQEDSIDRHTGEHVLKVRTAADAIYEARLTGNTHAALEKIRMRREFFAHPALERLQAALEAELGAPLEEPPAAHPDAPVIAAEQARARALRAELERRVDERLDHASLLAFLSDLEADAAIGAATEDFFAPLARWPARHPDGPARPDELAVRTLARLADPGTSVDREAFLGVTGAYRSQNRPRARRRWLLRMLGAFPGMPEIREEVLAAYLESGRTIEAFLVVGTLLQERPDDLDLWRWRAKLGGWLSRPEQEAEAREVLLFERDDPATRERLITLYTYAGRPEDAVDHALVLARGATDAAVLERPAKLALQGGDVDRALGILEDLATAADDPAPWREKIVAYAWQDLRVERVIRELKLLMERYPERDYGQRLESVYRRRNMTGELCALLDARLRRQPPDRPDETLENEAMALHAVLGHQDRVKEILLQRVERTTGPRDFFANLATYRALDLPGLGGIAARMAEQPQLERDHVAEILGNLRPLLDDPPYREAATIVAHRFPDHPVAAELLIHFADLAPDDKARAAIAAGLARDHPDQPRFLRAWMERAGWAGDVESELQARELWHERAPDDLDNRLRLARLLATAGRTADAVGHWEALAEAGGVKSEAALALIDALFAVGRLDEAVALLEKRAALPGATIDDKVHVGDQLFGSARYDRALRFYEAVLDAQPDHGHALLRAGQIHAWTNDPHGAIPYLSRRIEVSDEDADEVRYYLGEAHFSVGESERGRRLHARALEELRARGERTVDQDIMVARILARFGRIEEAQPLFESILEKKPDAVHLILDYADAMVAVENLGKARELVDRARSVQPGLARAMQLDGRVALLESRYGDATRILAETLERHGSDAGTEAELGRALELAGDWTPAAEALRRSLKLQPDNRDAARSLQRLADRLARLVHTSLGYRKAGDDEVLELWAAGSVPVRGETTRIGAAAGISRYVGRAAAVGAGLADLEESVFHLQGSVHHRLGALHTVAGGVSLYPGAPGDLPAGAWAGLLFADRAPYRAASVRVYGNLLLETPAAAVALGGRRSGVQVRGQHDVGERFWAAAELGYALLSLDRPAGGTASEGFLEGTLTFGWRVLEGATTVADRLRVDEARLPGLLGTEVGAVPADASRPLLSLWISYQALRLMGDGEIATLVPLGDRFDYLVVAGRTDVHLARGLGATVEAYAGADLGASETIYGIQGGVTWRPAHATELTVVLGYGTALGRDGDTESFLVRLGFSYRW